MRIERFGIIIFFFILFFILLEIRIISISLFPDARLLSDKSKQEQRGAIYDRYGKELAVPVAFYSLYVRPRLMSQEMKNSVYQSLAGRNLFSANELSVIFTDKQYVFIKRKLWPQDIPLVQEVIDYYKKNNNLTKDELGLSREPGRLYPCRALSHVVGIVGVDNTGLSGLEHSLNSKLDLGLEIHTTLDANLSTIAYEELKKGIQENKAEGGSVAIMAVDGREILALTDYPVYDPNDYKTVNSAILKSRVTSGIFEPGSVMKQFSAGYALEKGLASPTKPVYQCTGSAVVYDREFQCENAHGAVNLARIIQKSCNIGMIQVADSFNRKEFYDYLKKYGFGEAPNMPFGENEGGILRAPDKWSAVSKYMVSIGQEIGVTTVQLITAASVIGSKGVYRTPVLISQILGQEAKTNIYWPAVEEYRVISESTAQNLLGMMETVVSEDGTALAARIEGVPIAGKTGTGQVAKEGGGGYYKNVFNAVFIGYIPADNPKYIVAVVINRPSGDKHTGGLVSAPVFGNIVRRMISSTAYFTH